MRCACAHCGWLVEKFKAHNVSVEGVPRTYHPDCCPGCGLCDLPWEH